MWYATSFIVKDEQMQLNTFDQKKSKGLIGTSSIMIPEATA
jgi:hypothetical protein